MSLDRKMGRGWLCDQVNDNLTLNLSDIHSPSAEVVTGTPAGGGLRCVLEVGHASIIMPLSVAEAIADALRFHEMNQRGEIEEVWP